MRVWDVGSFVGRFKSGAPIQDAGIVGVLLRVSLTIDYHLLV